MGFLRRFMYGRYGADTLGSFTLAIYLILWLVGLFTGWWVIHILCTALAFVTLFRMLSRNIPRRRAENEKFLAIFNPIRRRWHAANMKRTDKAHKYFRCPHCGQQLRVPRGAGKIRVSCRSCGTQFEEQS